MAAAAPAVNAVLAWGMEMRLRALATLDPLAVPLPNGTEVVTRVDRVLQDGHRVAEGALGVS